MGRGHGNGEKDGSRRLAQALAAPPVPDSGRRRASGCHSTTGSSLTLGGIPFFYWYQLAWVLIAACIVMSVYVIETRITRANRAAKDLEAPGPPGDLL